MTWAAGTVGAGLNVQLQYSTCNCGTECMSIHDVEDHHYDL